MAELFGAGAGAAADADAAPERVGSGVVTPGCVGPMNWLHWAMVSALGFTWYEPQAGFTTMLSRSTWPMLSSGFEVSVCQKK